ncbi:hypothetical protein AA309_24695 [Microvirga vignae]|uniref:Uncharacterized protein n=1 Tax=Microvirga vignae TaxID=1225564 RepID=A0A0H1R6G2_9HYPH|nr:hypothetical protein AA309_24695 [Microvirga vignae]
MSGIAALNASLLLRMSLAFRRIASQQAAEPRGQYLQVHVCKKAPQRRAFQIFPARTRIAASPILILRGCISRSRLCFHELVERRPGQEDVIPGLGEPLPDPL